MIDGESLLMLSVLRQGESWQKLRTIANPVMLQPKIVRLYVRPVDEIAQEFIEMYGDVFK